MTGSIRFEQSSAGIARLTLCKARRHNALDADMIREIAEIATRRSPLPRALILAAEGESFCAGADLGWMKQQFEATAEDRFAAAEALQAMLQSLDEYPALVIGLVQGPAYGGGVGLLSVCDVVIASRRSRFALTETRLGLIPAVVAPFLHRRIGAAALRAIGLNGMVLDPERALSLGLVSELCEEGALEQAAARHIASVLDCAPGAVAEAKALFRSLASGTPRDAHVIEALAARWQSEEAQAGITAFFAREAPPWKR
jgi:methylglutaconyl-CoA hydratase